MLKTSPLHRRAIQQWVLGHCPQLKPLTKKSASSHLSHGLPNQSNTSFPALLQASSRWIWQWICQLRWWTCLLIQVNRLDTRSPSSTGIDTWIWTASISFTATTTRGLQPAFQVAFSLWPHPGWVGRAASSTSSHCRDLSSTSLVACGGQEVSKWSLRKSWCFLGRRILWVGNPKGLVSWLLRSYVQKNIRRNCLG